MSDTNTQAETTTERKPPTIADIVREKTGDGALIIDFFTDVMTGRIEGAQLCHRIDAAKQLVKYGSKDAAEFIAKYKGVPCGHSINGRPDPADPCTAPDRSLVAVTLNAPATLTRDFLAVLSGIDEFLMARLIRAQTADGVTVIEFLDDVMQDRTDGFKTHHRIAAAKELIVHIIRDEQPSHTPSPSTRETDKRGDSDTPSPLTGEGWGDFPTPSPSTGEGWGDSPVVGADPRVRPLPGSHTPSPSTGEGGACPESPRRSEGDSPVVGADPRVRPLPGSHTPSPSTGKGWGEGDSPVVGADPCVRPLPGSHTPSPSTGEGWGEGDSPVVGADPRVRPLPGSQRETNNSKLKTLPTRRDGNARAAIRRKALGSERIEEEKDEKPAPAELTIAERRINENSNSTGTSRTLGPDPSTPQHQAAHPPSSYPLSLHGRGPG